MKEAIERKTKVIFNPNHPNSNIHGMVLENGNPTCFTNEDA